MSCWMACRLPNGHCGQRLDRVSERYRHSSPDWAALSGAWRHKGTSRTEGRQQRMAECIPSCQGLADFGNDPFTAVIDVGPRRGDFAVWQICYLQFVKQLLSDRGL